MGLEGKTHMSEDYEKFHEIPPFKVKANPSILINDENYPWLRRNKQNDTSEEKVKTFSRNYYDDAFDLEYHCSNM